MNKMIPKFIAFFIGWLLYIIYWLYTSYHNGYEGYAELITMPFFTAVMSAISVGIVLLVGLVLRIPPLKRWWSHTWLWAASIVIVSLFILRFGKSLGLKHINEFDNSQKSIEGFPRSIVFICFFSILFAVANWPMKKKLSNQSIEDSNDQPDRSPVDET